MSDTPSTTESNGRGPAGRFGEGNRFGKGNPHARRVARLRSTLLKRVTPDDLRDVVAALLAQAKAGEVATIKELLQRLLGPPVELDLIGIRVTTTSLSGTSCCCASWRSAASTSTSATSPGTR